MKIQTVPLMLSSTGQEEVKSMNIQQQIRRMGQDGSIHHRWLRYLVKVESLQCEDRSWAAQRREERDQTRPGLGHTESLMGKSCRQVKSRGSLLLRWVVQWFDASEDLPKLRQAPTGRWMWLWSSLVVGSINSSQYLLSILERDKNKKVIYVILP